MELKSGKLTTLEFYGNREVNGKDDRRNHAVITLFEKNDPADYFSRKAEGMLYRKSSDETEVTGGYSASNINTSEITERLAQFNERLNNRSKVHIATITKGIEKTRVIANPPSKLEEFAVASFDAIKLSQVLGLVNDETLSKYIPQQFRDDTSKLSIDSNGNEFSSQQAEYIKDMCYKDDSDAIRKIRQLFANYGGFRSEFNEATLSQLDMLKDAEILLMKAIQAAQDGRTQEILNEGSAESLESKFSIVQSKITGEFFILLDSNVFDALMPGDRIHDYIREYIESEVGKSFKIFESGEMVYLGDDIPGEYTQSKETQRLKSTRPNLLYAKNQLALNLEEALFISSFNDWEANRKPKHSIDAKFGFYKYSTKFGILTNNNKIRLFEANMLIRHAADNNMYLYDVLDIKKAGSMQVGDISSPYGVQSTPHNYTAINRNVPLSGTEFNRRLDKKYEASVFYANNTGDWSRVQQMVDEAAQKSGYKELRFHETKPENDIHVFTTDNAVNASGDPSTPYGIFTKRTDAPIGLGGKQMKLLHKKEANLFHLLLPRATHSGARLLTVEYHYKK